MYVFFHLLHFQASDGWYWKWLGKWKKSTLNPDNAASLCIDSNFTLFLNCNNCNNNKSSPSTDNQKTTLTSDTIDYTNQNVSPSSPNHTVQIISNQLQNKRERQSIETFRGNNIRTLFRHIEDPNLTSMSRPTASDRSTENGAPQISCNLDRSKKVTNHFEKTPFLPFYKTNSDSDKEQGITNESFLTPETYQVIFEIISLSLPNGI